MSSSGDNWLTDSNDELDSEEGDLWDVPDLEDQQSYDVRFVRAHE